VLLRGFSADAYSRAGHLGSIKARSVSRRDRVDTEIGGWSRHRAYGKLDLASEENAYLLTRDHSGAEQELNPFSRFGAYE